MSRPLSPTMIRALEALDLPGEPLLWHPWRNHGTTESTILALEVRGLVETDAGDVRSPMARLTPNGRRELARCRR